MRRLFITICLLCGLLTEVSAQWRAGVYAGAGSCEREIQGVYDYARSRSAVPGVVAGVSGQYNFTDWLGLRMDVNMQWRNYDDVYSVVTEQYRNRNIYVDVPLMACFSFGGNRLRGYVNLGGYAGIWASRKVFSKPWQGGNFLSLKKEYVQSGFSRAENRFDAGLAGGIGISYLLCLNLVANAECMLYYGLTDSHNTGSSRFIQPSYDTTPCVCLGIAWQFD